MVKNGQKHIFMNKNDEFWRNGINTTKHDIIFRKTTLKLKNTCKKS